MGRANAANLSAVGWRWCRWGRRFACRARQPRCSSAGDPDRVSRSRSQAPPLGRTVARFRRLGATVACERSARAASGGRRHRRAARAGAAARPAGQRDRARVAPRPLPRSLGRARDARMESHGRTRGGDSSAGLRQSGSGRESRRRAGPATGRTTTAGARQRDRHRAICGPR